MTTPDDYPELDLTRSDPYVQGTRLKVHDIVFAAGRDNTDDNFEFWQLTDAQVAEALQYYLDQRGIWMETVEEVVDDEDVEAALERYKKRVEQ